MRTLILKCDPGSETNMEGAVNNDINSEIILAVLEESSKEYWYKRSFI